MNSSTSSFEAWGESEGEREAWRRFSFRALALVLTLTLAFYAVMVPLDPYGTGILTPFAVHGTFAKGPRIGNASRVHDQRFNAAIFGNSHIMSLSPQRLSDATGYRFAMLAIPGTDPPEQLQVVDAYLDRHTRPQAVVVSVDSTYCGDDPVDPTAHAFPDWLYSASRVDYLKGLARLSTLEAAGQRIALFAGWKRPQPADGSMDIFEGHGPSPEDAARIAATPRDAMPATSVRPGLAMLEQRLDRIAPETSVVIILPPVAPSVLPQPGTATTVGLADCKARLAGLVAHRPNTALVDWHRPDPRLEGARLFFDGTHYYDPVARLVETDVAGALARLRQGG